MTLGNDAGVADAITQLGQQFTSTPSAREVVIDEAHKATNRGGQPEKSLLWFSGFLFLVLVFLLFGGLPPVTAVTALAMTVMLTVVVDARAGWLFGGGYFLAWLSYIVLNALQLAPVRPTNCARRWRVSCLTLKII